MGEKQETPDRIGFRSGVLLVADEGFELARVVELGASRKRLKAHEINDNLKLIDGRLHQPTSNYPAGGT